MNIFLVAQRATMWQKLIARQHIWLPNAHRVNNGSKMRWPAGKLSLHLWLPIPNFGGLGPADHQIFEHWLYMYNSKTIGPVLSVSLCKTCCIAAHDSSSIWVMTPNSRIFRAFQPTRISHENAVFCHNYDLLFLFLPRFYHGPAFYKIKNYGKQGCIVTITIYSVFLHQVSSRLLSIFKFLRDVLKNTLDFAPFFISTRGSL